MVALGAVDERVRRSTLTDAAVETALATVGALAAATLADSLSEKMLLGDLPKNSTGAAWASMTGSDSAAIR